MAYLDMEKLKAGTVYKGKFPFRNQAEYVKYKDGVLLSKLESYNSYYQEDDITYFFFDGWEEVPVKEVPALTEMAKGLLEVGNTKIAFVCQSEAEWNELLEAIENSTEAKWLGSKDNPTERKGLYMRGEFEIVYFNTEDKTLTHGRLSYLEYNQQYAVLPLYYGFLKKHLVDKIKIQEA